MQDGFTIHCKVNLIKTHYTLPCICSLCSSPYIDLRRRLDLFFAALFCTVNLYSAVIVSHTLSARKSCRYIVHYWVL